MHIRKEYTVQDIWKNNDEEIVDLLNKYSHIVEEKDKKIEELRELIAEIRLKAPLDSDIFLFLDHVKL